MSESFERFRALHATGCFVMPNAWDAASAAILGREGFPAIASTSAGIAWALGRPDGFGAVSREEAIANAALLHRASGLPVNGDLEDGFGPGPEDCARTVEAAIAGGLAGLGIEDTTGDPANPIHAFDDAVRRMQAAAKAAQGRILLTGRTDNFLHGRPDLDDTIRRLVAFAEAGADALYAPGLPDMAAVRAVVQAVAPKPVNVLVGPRSGPVPLAELAAAGGRRVSTGGALYRLAMGALRDAGRRMREGDMALFSGAPTGAEIEGLLPGR